MKKIYIKPGISKYMVEHLDSVSRTFAEYILIPGHTKKNMSSEDISLKTPLLKFSEGESSDIELKTPLTSACMQAVSGPELAIALAKEGGMSFIFASQPIKSEAEMVSKVKDYKAGFVESKVNLSPNAQLKEGIEITEKTGYSTIPITKDGKNNSKLLGMLTDQDYWKGYDSEETKVKELMTPFKELRTGSEGISLEEANKILRDSKKSCIPIIDEEKKLKKLVFKKDRDMTKEYPNALEDEEKKLIVGAAINTHDYKERTPELVKAGVDVLVIDTSDGHSEYVKDTLDWVKKNYPEIPVGAGNIVDKRGFEFLAENGADFVKVGIGGGSICITQEVKGIGRGQATAVSEVVEARDHHFKEKGEYIPVCSDGGLSQDSHILLSLATGADFVMMGRYFARTEESPTKKRVAEGKGLSKPYWGEGSKKAQNWRRYHEDKESELPFEEGVVGWVPYAGSLKKVVRKSKKVLKSTMTNLGCRDLEGLREDAHMELRSKASIREGSPHDIDLKRDEIGEYKGLFWGK